MILSGYLVVTECVINVLMRGRALVFYRKSTITILISILTNKVIMLVSN